MKRYFLGIDIGGSKSHALISDENGKAISFGIDGPGNYEIVGREGLRRTLKAIVNQTLNSGGINKNEIAGAGYGIAGFDWYSEKKFTNKIIHSLNLNAPYKLVNDTVIGLVAGSRKGWGISVVAGTNCNCYGRDQNGKEWKMTGCGHLAGEYAGAFDIVVKGIQAIAFAATNRGPSTNLKKEFLKYTGASSTMDMLKGIKLNRYKISANMAPIVFNTAEEGDIVASEIIKWAGRKLSELAICVIHQLKFEKSNFEIILVGSLFKASPFISESMYSEIRSIAPGAELILLDTAPVVGGVLLGMQTVGMQYSNFRKALIDSTRGLLERKF